MIISIVDDIRTGAASYLNSAISDNLKKKKNVYYGQIIIGLLLDVGIDPFLKRLLERAIINILEQLG